MHESHDALNARLKTIVEKEPQLAFLDALNHGPVGAEWFLVGGAVRDAIIGRAGRKDFDLLVRGAALEPLAERLSTLGDTNFVGKRFGVLKFRPHGSVGEVDIAWPRTELAGGSGGYRDFTVQADPTLPVTRDLARRDFTVNAIAWNLKTGMFVDPHGGIADIGERVLRAVGEPAARFAEDYSRMLRAIRFACELDFAIAPGTWDALVRLASHINDLLPDGERVVPYETVAREFVKAMAADPARAVELFEASGLLFELMPELRALATCAQPPDHHSEGNVWTHTKLALAQLTSEGFTARFAGDRADATLAIALLLHDIAKPETAMPGPKGQTVFYGHAERGAEIARHVVERLLLASAGVDTDRLAWLIKMHLVPNMLRVDEVRRTTLEKHFLRDREAGRSLLHLAFADASASVRADGSTDLSNLDELMKALAVLDRRGASPDGRKSLVTGEEVMTLTGLEAGPEVGALLESLREAQLAGQVATPEDARAFLVNAHRHDES